MYGQRYVISHDKAINTVQSTTLFTKKCSRFTFRSCRKFNGRCHGGIGVVFNSRDATDSLAVGSMHAGPAAVCCGGATARRDEYDAWVISHVDTILFWFLVHGGVHVTAWRTRSTRVEDVRQPLTELTLSWE